MRRKVLLIAAPALAALVLSAVFAGILSHPDRNIAPVRPLALEAAGSVRATLVATDTAWRPLPLATTGRALPGPHDSLVQEWPAFHVEAQFRGTALRVRFEDASNRWRVTLDRGDLGRVLLSEPGSRDLLIQGLPPGAHEVRVEKISESSMPTRFGGIFVAEAQDALPAPAPAPRLIEFIGDSDTVGFANGASRRDCTEAEVYASTDTSQSFGPQAARRLGADYRMVARSGIGLLRNYGGATPDATMPWRYGLALPSEPARGQDVRPPADVVVTALGSNDFGSDLTESEPWKNHEALSRDFASKLIEFLQARVAENPGALQVLLAFGEYGDALVLPYQAAEAHLRAEHVPVILVVLPKLERRACFWHPSAKDHQMIAETLVKAIEGSGS
ncbi:MAG: lipase [Paracoccus sp. (in: a-proteobacteria)]|uniref:SGNH/GDSL hydrolase family protein n=1 Tax=Paracoccus sp. TaxID=267 RepID=UPI0039E3A306